MRVSTARDPVELELHELRKYLPLTEREALNLLKSFVSVHSLDSITWLLAAYPQLATDGLRHFAKVRHPLSWERKLPDTARLLLSAGAKSTNRPGRMDDDDLMWVFWKNNKGLNFQWWRAVCSHFIDYGTWISKWNPHNWAGLYYQWELRYRQRDARIMARKALWIAMRRRRVSKDVVRMLIKSPPLSDELSWKAWKIDE